jgi:hypothetical protein
MVSMPYTALGVVGFLIYRGCKKNAEYLNAGEKKACAKGDWSAL